MQRGGQILTCSVDSSAAGWVKLDLVCRFSQLQSGLCLLSPVRQCSAEKLVSGRPYTIVAVVNFGEAVCLNVVCKVGTINAIFWVGTTGPSLAIKLGLDSTASRLTVGSSDTNRRKWKFSY